MCDLDAVAIVMPERKRGTRMCFAAHKFARIRCAMRREIFVTYGTRVPREKSQRKKLPAFPGEAAKRKCLGMHYHAAVSFHHSLRYLAYMMSPTFLFFANNYIFRHLISIQNFLAIKTARHSKSF